MEKTMPETIKTKRCCACKQNLQPSEFCKSRNRPDGLSIHCRTCKRTFGRRYENSPKGRIATTRYRQSPKGKVASKEAMRRTRIDHPDRMAARLAVTHAVQSGKLPSASSLQCDYCPSTAKHYHHHKGYGEKHRLDVIPLCHICHVHIHSKLPTQSKPVGI